jgi:2-hydroxy-3-oxopropionate reductase
MEKVGFVGLGIMGTAMARNLLRAGHELTVHNRTRAKAEQLAKDRAEISDIPREVAEKSDVVITMLPGPPEVEEVVSGKDGLLEGAREGSLIVDMSTSSPILARELSDTARGRGVGMLDAPVSGGDVGALEGTLSIMVGGEEEDFERARPSSRRWARRSSTSEAQGPVRWSRHATRSWWPRHRGRIRGPGPGLEGRGSP